MARQRGQPGELQPEVRRGRIDWLNIYEISEAELELLARGSADSLYLNFAIFLLSVSASFIVSLMTTTIESGRVFTVFVVLAVVGAVNGGVLLALWYMSYRSVSGLVETIKRRLPSGMSPGSVGPPPPAP
jgi:hypothetical protein